MPASATRQLLGGMKQRIGIAQLCSTITVLIVDEPTSAGPEQRIAFRNLLTELRRPHRDPIDAYRLDVEATATDLRSSTMAGC